MNRCRYSGNSGVDFPSTDGGPNVPLKVLSNMYEDEDWSFVLGSALDTTKGVPGLGNHSIKFTPATGATLQYAQLNIEGTNSDEEGMIVDGELHHWFWITDVTKINKIEIRLYPDIVESNVEYFTGFPIITNEPQYGTGDGAWYKIVTKRFTNTVGGITWDYANGQRIKQLRIDVTSEGAETVEMWYGGTLVENFPKAAICIGFDGVYRNAGTYGLAYMQARGMLGVGYAVGLQTYASGTSTAGTRLNVAELQAYQALGWDIIPHAWSLTASEATPEADMVADILHGKAWANKCGFHGGADIGSPVAHQGTSDNADTRGLAAEYYIASRQFWRDDARYKTSNGYPGITSIFAWIKNDYMQINNLGIHDDSLANNKIMIDQLVGLRGFTHLFTHQLIEGATDATNTNIDDFTGLIDYIQTYVNAGTLEVITLTEYLRRTILRSQSYASDEDGGVTVRTNSTDAAGVAQQLY